MSYINPYDSDYFESDIDGSELRAVISLNNIKSLTKANINVLHDLEIYTVSNLLRFKPIHDAKFLVAIENGEIVHDCDYNHLIDSAILLSIPSLSGILNSECVVLVSVTPSENVLLKQLGITSIRGLANYTVYNESLELIEKSNNLFQEAQSAPAELIPKLKGSVHSVARFVSYIRNNTVKLPISMLKFDSYSTSITDPFLRSLFIPDIANKNHEKALDAILKIHLGYIAEFKLKWVFVSTQLGEIVHSLALAPGESRNITIVDWKRAQISSRTENAGTSEQLTNDLYHRRALDEVTSATAIEHVEGTTTAEGGSVGGSMAITAGASQGSGGAAKGNYKGVDFVGAASEANSSGAGAVMSGAYQKGTVTSSSDGIRNINAKESQNIMDTISQKASNLRSLWSTVVAEDMQTENKEINTRNVTNYNHSHALTIQYYEVLHRYRAEIRLTEATPLLFLPFSPLNFNIELIVKYWSVLKYHLNSSNELVKKIEPVVDYFRSGKAIYNLQNEIKLTSLAFRVDTKDNFMSKNRNPSIDIPDVYLIGTTTFPYDIDIPSFNPTLKLSLENFKRIDITTDQETIQLNIRLTFTKTSSSGVASTEEFIRTIEDQNLTVICRKAIFQLPADILDLIQNNRPSQQLIEEVVNYFNAHRYFFTKIIVSNIETEQLVDLIEGLVLTVNGHDLYLMDLIDYSPVGIADNTIIFKLNGKLTNPASFKGITKNESLLAQNLNSQEKQDKTTPINEIMLHVDKVKSLSGSEENSAVSDDIYLPTSGIFAEAVLGRSNASEKIDITRYYNWQDSPIPHLAPEIAPADPSMLKTKFSKRYFSNIFKFA